MKKVKLYLFVALCFNYSSCFSQNEAFKKDANTQKGVLMYFMNEPYFFPITDTSIEKISKSNVMGLKLSKFDLNDIFENISHKSDIVIYLDGGKNKIDTLKSKIGVLLIKLETKVTETKLSSDTTAFNFEYHPNTWGLFRYVIRFDTEVLSIVPLLSSDIKAFKQHLKALQ